MTALFHKEEGGREYTANAKPETIIGPTVKVEGTFDSQDTILVDGVVMGSLKTTKDLTVGQGARIEADVTAVNMHIAGEVHGNLKASGSLTLTSSARVYGDVETGIISVETGAVIQGRCVASGGKGAAPASAPSANAALASTASPKDAVSAHGEKKK